MIPPHCRISMKPMNSVSGSDLRLRSRSTSTMIDEVKSTPSFGESPHSFVDRPPPRQSGMSSIVGVALACRRRTSTFVLVCARFRHPRKNRLPKFLSSHSHGARNRWREGCHLRLARHNVLRSNQRPFPLLFARGALPHLAYGTTFLILGRFKQPR